MPPPILMRLPWLKHPMRPKPKQVPHNQVQQPPPMPLIIKLTLLQALLTG